MIEWLIGISIVYLGILGTLAWRSRQKNTSADSFMLGGQSLGYIIGFMTVAATMFSTFTLMGMPDFFRLNGIGAWIFLAVSDGAMIFVIIWFAYYLRRKVARNGFKGMAGLLNKCYNSKTAGFVYFAGIFLFLIPYVAIQIRGIGIFLEAVFPNALPYWGWGLCIIGLMLLYSETGGLKAIIFADVLQGTLLMIVVWLIASSCVKALGGVAEMFAQVEQVNAPLLSVPGPNGLFSVQFMLGSFLVLLLMPITQPQFSTRLVIMRDLKATHRMAVAVGCFAILVIMPTIPIGLYGALNYADLSTADFLSQVLLFDQVNWIAAAAIIGLIAAAISTSDSQIFALGSEFRSLLGGTEKANLFRAKIAILVFAFAAWVFSIFASDQLVLLARVSFAGTAMMGPMILAAILTQKKQGSEIIVVSAIGLLAFLASLLGIIPDSLWGFRLDLILLGLIGLVTVISVLLRKGKGEEDESQVAETWEIANQDS